jgi:hypothetical protein
MSLWICPEYQWLCGTAKNRVKAWKEWFWPSSGSATFWMPEGIDRHLHTSEEGLDLCTRGALTERDADRIRVVTRYETKRRKTLISRGARDRYRYWWLRVAPNDIDRGIGVVAGTVIQKDRINLSGIEPASAGRGVAGVECNELPAIPIDLRHVLTPLFSGVYNPRFGT